MHSCIRGARGPVEAHMARQSVRLDWSGQTEGARVRQTMHPAEVEPELGRTGGRALVDVLSQRGSAPQERPRQALGHTAGRSEMLAGGTGLGDEWGVYFRAPVACPQNQMCGEGGQVGRRSSSRWDVAGTSACAPGIAGQAQHVALKLRAHLRAAEQLRDHLGDHLGARHAPACAQTRVDPVACP